MPESNKGFRQRTLLTNHTLYTHENLKRLAQSNFRKYRPLLWFLTIVLLLIAALTMVSRVLAGDAVVRLLVPSASGLLMIAAIVLLWLVTSGFFYTHAQSEEDSRLMESGVSYEFRSQSFTVETKQTGVTGSLTLEYDYLLRVYETCQEFFLYAGSGQTWIVDKNSFSTGTPKEMRTLLGKFIPPNRYTCCPRLVVEMF